MEREKFNRLVAVYEQRADNYRKQTRECMLELQDQLKRAANDVERYVKVFDDGEVGAAEWAINLVEQLVRVTNLVAAYKNFQDAQGYVSGMKDAVKLIEHVDS